MKVTDERLVQPNVSLNGNQSLNNDFMWRRESQWDSICTETNLVLYMLICTSYNHATIATYRHDKHHNKISLANIIIKCLNCILHHY